MPAPHHPPPSDDDLLEGEQLEEFVQSIIKDDEAPDPEDPVKEAADTNAKKRHRPDADS